MAISQHVQHARGTAAQLDAYTGPDGEILVDTTNNTLRLQLHGKLGGYPIASEAYVASAISSSGAGVLPATATPKAPGTAAVGTSAKYAREDHVHPSQTTISGNAGTATKLQTARTINGVSFDGTSNITIPVPAAGTTTPKNIGTAAVGTATTFARADHVHAPGTISTSAPTSSTGANGDLWFQYI